MTAELHIFRAGRQTPMSGEAIDFSEADLAACAAAYDPNLHEAPIVVGHPAANAPAYGWIKKLSADRKGLYATPHQVDPAFSEIVATGRYKKISASFYLPASPCNPKPGVLYLRHVGFLGAQPPAVKGLRQPTFAEAEEGVVEFGDWVHETNANLWRRLREWLLTQFGQETADQVVPDWNINSIRDEALRPEPEPNPVFSETLVENTVTSEEAATLANENARLKNELENLNAANKAEALARRHDENVAFAEKMVSEARIVSSAKALVVSFLDLAGDSGATTEFGEGDQNLPLDIAFRQFLATHTPLIAFGEHATKDKAVGASSDDAIREFAEKPVDSERLTLHVRARALAAEKGIPYGTAVRQVINAS